MTISEIIKEAGVPSRFSFILTSSTGRHYSQNCRYRDQLHKKNSSAENLAALQMALHHKTIPVFILYYCVYLYCSVVLGIFCTMATWLLGSLWDNSIGCSLPAWAGSPVLTSHEFWGTYCSYLHFCILLCFTVFSSSKAILLILCLDSWALLQQQPERSALDTVTQKLFADSR